MGDIEAIYYQVRVSEEQRSVLRFLWWEDSNLGGDLLDHWMCVHVFGGTSSPGCCNYALRKTAIDNKVRYGEETSRHCYTTSMWMISLSQWKLKI